MYNDYINLVHYFNSSWTVYYPSKGEVQSVWLWTPCSHLHSSSQQWAEQPVYQILLRLRNWSWNKQSSLCQIMLSLRNWSWNKQSSLCQIMLRLRNWSWHTQEDRIIIWMTEECIKVNFRGHIFFGLLKTWTLSTTNRHDNMYWCCQFLTFRDPLNFWVR